MLQGAELMSKFGIHVPQGMPAKTIAEVEAAAEKMKDESGQVPCGLLLLHWHA